MHRLRTRVASPAMVVALTALVFSIVGTAAAAGVMITSSKQVKNGAIQTADLSKKTRTALKGQKGGTGATGAQGARGTDGSQGAKGDTGTGGATGATGAPGATSVTVKRAVITVPANGVNSVATIACPPGARATGGGFNAGGVNGTANQSVPSSDAGPNLSPDGSTPNGWRVQLKNPELLTTQGEIFVVCAAP